MPQLDPSTYPTQLVWLLITFAILFLVVWRMALPRITQVRDSRQRRIEDDLQRAESLREEAETVLAVLEKSHADAAEEALRIHREAAQAMSEARAEKQAEVAARLAEETGAAEQRIAGEKDRAATTIPNVAADVVRAAVERLVGARGGEVEIETAIQAAGRRGEG